MLCEDLTTEKEFFSETEALLFPTDCQQERISMGCTDEMIATTKTMVYTKENSLTERIKWLGFSPRCNLSSSRTSWNRIV